MSNRKGRGQRHKKQVKPMVLSSLTPAFVDQPTDAVLSDSVSLSPSENVGDRGADALIARFALETWRLRRRLDRYAQSAAPEPLRPLQEGVRRLEDVLLSAHVEFRDHIGERYSEGLQVEVIHIRDGDNGWQIVETIQPSILVSGRVVRQAQVVIGSASTATVSREGAGTR